MYSYGAGTSNQGRPYQGYPYVNPLVHDVGTINAVTAAQWNHLPRRPASHVRVHEQPGSSRQGISVNNIPPRNTPVPESETSSQNTEGSPEKIDYDANPVVYIDVPESSSSEVVEQRRPPVEEESFVEQTIFYDQFKDRTVITVSSDGGSESGSTHSVIYHSPTRPARPVTLNLGSDNGYTSSSMASSSGAPPMMSKEAAIYGNYPTENSQTQMAGMRDFPQPPPAYSEYDTLTPTAGTPGQIPGPGSPLPPAVQVTQPMHSPQTPPGGVPGSSSNLPVTQVIVTPPYAIKNPKVIQCTHCGLSSQSLTVRQVGFATHVVVFVLFLLGLFPCAVILYCTDYCRYKNHYCKYCNKQVAYEIPFLSKELTYVP